MNAQHSRMSKLALHVCVCVYVCVCVWMLAQVRVCMQRVRPFVFVPCPRTWSMHVQDEDKAAVLRTSCAWKSAAPLTRGRLFAPVFFSHTAPCGHNLTCDQRVSIASRLRGRANKNLQGHGEGRRAARAQRQLKEHQYARRGHPCCCIYRYIHLHTHIQKYTHAHTHTHTHTQTTTPTPTQKYTHKH